MTNEAQAAYSAPTRTDRGPRKAFDKPHLEPEALIVKLRGQGMVIDAKTALPYLRQIGGYRLKGYWYQWQDAETRRFRGHVHFDQVIRRYEFDRELRRITSDALERIELAVRTVMSNVLSRREGPHWFMKEDLFTWPQGWRHQTFLEKVRDEIDRVRKKPFIAHYRATYDSPEFPPSWVVSECLSFGSWTHAYKGLANGEYRKEISRRFGVEACAVFDTWLYAFAVLRNTVAHHGRLLGAQTSVTPGDYRKRGLSFNRRRTFFVTASVISYIGARLGYGRSWEGDLQSLMERFPDIPVELGLGFPPNWREQPGWASQSSIPRLAQ
ncbi:Abi family protein [Achromobacter sp. GD03932]|uniref:Abi family protein n=1 Tax=Achromobacter sp. GD03932 TaxID=2975407 RepID=UPI0024489DB2|nr:Abi family protein [Achromobacter sp. GD03932]MDH1303240.1 Abi family protein [Achromobacter sp. GD03932]